MSNNENYESYEEEKIFIDGDYVDDETIDRTLDSLAKIFSKIPKNEDGHISVTNPRKAEAVIYTYKVLKHITKGTSTKVTCRLNEPVKSVGVVSVVGKEIIFDNPLLFVAAAKAASNVDVYPKTDGTIQLDFGFNGITDNIKIIEEGGKE